MPRKSLQKLIDECTFASGMAWRAQAALNERCEEMFGMTPSDVDCDEVLDSVFAASGPGRTMPEKQFTELMKRAIGFES